MNGKVLALIENNIAMRLLLTSRLSALGYHVTVVSSPQAFRRQIEAQPFDWLILHEAALVGAPDLLTRTAQQHEARIVWLGRAPRQRELPIAARFATPLVYGEIARYFSQQGLRDSQGHAEQPRETITQAAALQGAERS
jgi:DNA-binding NtrC family response regulator